MNKRKIIISLLVLAITVSCVSCGEKDEQIEVIKPKVSQMKSICELATMECYYHNVAKYYEEDASGFLFWKKDKNFWIEYSGVVKIGIDVSLVTIEVNEDSVIISIPNAKVLGEKVDETSLTEDSYIVDDKSADIEAEDQTQAFTYAQENMVQVASEDTALLASAQQRAQTLIEEYITNIGEVVGKEYTIEWKYISDEDQGVVSTPEVTPDNENTDSGE